ncbi:MAG: hypothetical protein JWN83_3022 [Chitinophagaceae bacterium]|nr:hypothetical protein [Chitinophagaceae bacterium]
MIAALYTQTNSTIMKKILLMAILGGLTYFGAAAQGNSAYGHSHKKAKKHHHVAYHNNTDRTAINVRHRTAIRTVKQNDALSNRQQKDLVKQANTTHKVEMKRETMSNKGKK